MSGKTPMLSFEEALARVLALAEPRLPSESVALDDAEGRVLAHDLVATADMPAFDYSAMDGYALRARDALPMPARLLVRGESRTGAVPGALQAGTAMRIFTGAELPAGADAVVMQENAQRTGEYVELAQAVREGENVRRRGEDVRAGACVLAAGTCLRAAQLALCASLDRAEVSVARRPRVAIVATGDELRPAGSAAVAGTIAESNTIALRALARAAGADVRVQASVRDDRVAHERAFADALAHADVLVTIGGVSVGDHDQVRPALDALGLALSFWRVAIKPGKPVAAGRIARVPRVNAAEKNERDALVLSVPGNPSSALVTFALFGVPLLRALQGQAQPFPTYLRARTTHACAHKPGRLEFVRATLAQHADGSLRATPLANQASGAPTTIASADALLLVPAQSSDLAPGDAVDVLRLADLGC